MMFQESCPSNLGILSECYKIVVRVMQESSYKRNLEQELEADSYAVKKMSKILVHRAMIHIIMVFMGIDWTIAAEFMVRLHDLGYSKAKEMYIIAPNGLKFDVETVRKYL